MKKVLFLIGVLFVGSTFFSSCNKKLKDDISDLEKEIADLKAQQEQTKSILGSNEPIAATTTFVDDDGNTRTISSTYYFKSNDYSTQYMAENSDGTYDIYIERFSDVYWNEGAWAEFTYDPATQTISDERGGQYWDDNDSYGDGAYYDYSYSPAPTFNISINSINVTTGNISFSFSANADATYTNNNSSSWQTPNPGEEMSTSFSFSGKLKVFEYDGSTPVLLKKSYGKPQ